jgi:TPR repeat protein
MLGSADQTGVSNLTQPFCSSPAGDRVVRWASLWWLDRNGRREEAERWLRDAAESGDASATWDLVCQLQQRGRGAETIWWLRRLAHAGDTDAMWVLGWRLRQDGQIEEARRWEHWARTAGTGPPQATEVGRYTAT